MKAAAREHVRLQHHALLRGKGTWHGHQQQKKKICHEQVITWPGMPSPVTVSLAMLGCAGSPGSSNKRRPDTSSWPAGRTRHTVHSSNSPCKTCAGTKAGAQALSQHMLSLAQNCMLQARRIDPPYYQAAPGRRQIWMHCIRQCMISVSKCC